MEQNDIFICAECLRRIWRPSDKGLSVDSFLGDRHLKCENSVEAVKEFQASRK